MPAPQGEVPAPRIAECMTYLVLTLIPRHQEVLLPHNKVLAPHGEVPAPHNGMCDVPNAGNFDTNSPP